MISLISLIAFSLIDLPSPPMIFHYHFCRHMMPRASRLAIIRYA